MNIQIFKCWLGGLRRTIFGIHGRAFAIVINDDDTAAVSISLKERGLQGVELFISDKCLGLTHAIAQAYPEARWQRCAVHFYRNVFSVVPKGRVKEVAAMLKAIHAQEDRQAAEAKAREVTEKLKAMKLGKAAETLQTGIMETFSYFHFPREHWIRIKTNNMLERV